MQQEPQTRERRTGHQRTGGQLLFNPQLLELARRHFEGARQGKGEGSEAKGEEVEGPVAVNGGFARECRVLASLEGLLFAQ